MNATSAKKRRTTGTESSEEKRERDMNTSKLAAGQSTAGGRRGLVAARSTSGNKEARRAVEIAQPKAEAAVNRRAALSLFAGATALALNAKPSLAAYGEAANVFGSRTGNFTGFTPYEGDGYSVLLPAKWNPSNLKEFPGTDLR